MQWTNTYVPGCHLRYREKRSKVQIFISKFLYVVKCFYYIERSFDMKTSISSAVGFEKKY